MSRKAEFLAAIKPYVDRDSKREAKQDTIDLAKELSDVLSEINVKADGSDFKELKEAFNEQLTIMGKQPIVFSDNTLKGITAQFANAISEGIKAGVSSIDGEIAKLTKQRESLLEERDALNKQMKNKTLKEKLSNFNPLTTTPLEVSGDLKEEAIRIRKEFTDAYYELVDFTDDDGKFNTQLEGYEDAVLKAQQKAIQLMRMQKTLASNKDPSLNKQREKYAELIDGEEIEIVGDAFEELDDVFTEQSMRLEDIKITLQDINTKIQELQNKKVDIISDDNKEDVSYILKSLEEIEAAYNRISQKNGKLGKTSTKELNAALDPQQEFLSLTQLYGKYNTASETGADWEKLYNYAVRYVNKFESDLSANKISKDRLPKYTELYDTLKPIANDARESLKLLAEFKPTKSTSTQKQKSTEDIAPALHENNELLKRLLSDKEKSTFYDSKTGRYTPVKIGSENQVENSLDDVIKASKIYDTGIHSHRYKIAAPSVLGEDNDMDTWAKAIEYIKKRSIVAREEVLSFDFSSLTKEDIQNIIMQYREAASIVQKEFDDIRVNLQIGEKFGSFENFEEALQVRLREELEKIMQQYPGVMSSHAISLSTADASTRKSAANEDAAESARKAADEAERKAKAEREAADARRSELVSQLDKYVEDNRNADRAEFNLGEREKIYQSLVDENLITDEIKEKYAEVNKRLEDRLALLKQIREHEHNINGMPEDGLITNEDDPQVYYEEWFKPFTSDVENIRKSGLFSTEEIEHYNIRLAEMQDYLQSIALEALNNYLINPDEVDDAQKLNEILNQRQKILATVEQFDNPLDSPSSYEEAIKLNQAIKDRINFLQQPRSDTTGETEVEANQKKIKSYEDLLAIVQQYYNLKSKLRSINSDYPDGIDAQDYNPPIRAEMDSIEKLLSSKQINKEVLSVYEALNSDYSINEALQKIANALGIEIPQAARVAEGAVGNLNSELREGQSLMSQAPGSSALTGTGGASSEELKSLQNKNDQLRQEKENAEKDKNAANERANKAEAEAERLRNELVNRDKVDSDKSPFGATPIDTSELESLLGRVTYKVKFEGESPLDNSATVLETVKSALGNIQVNASADKDAPWAREDTLSGVIKNTLENIKSNTAGLSDAIKIAIAKTGEKVKEPVVKDYKKVTKDDYAGSTYFPEKLKTQVSKIEEYRAKLTTSGRLTQEMDKQIDDLLEKLRLVQNGPEFSVWSEEFKKLRIDENTSKIFDDFIGKENKNLYQELIDLKKQEYEWEIKLLNAQQGSAEETNARQELEAIQEKIKNHSVVYEDYEQELKLQKMQEEQLRKINELSSKQVDSNNKQKLKEETEVVKELNELYQQLAQAKAMADVETDSILRKPFEDRANQIQSEIYAKEANIDRAKYSQQFDNTQKESYKKQIIEELLELYAKLGEAEAKEDRMSIGNATAQQNKSEMDALYKRIEATQKLIDVNEELQNQFDAAQKTASDKVVAKANKADAVSDDKSFEKLGKQYEKLGKLRAQAQSTGSAVTQEDARQLEEAIKKEQERVSLSKEQTEELKRRLEVARQNELLRQNSIKQQKSFEQQIKDSRNKARLNTVNSAVRTSQDVLDNAMTIEGLSPESINRIKELSIEVNKLQNKYIEINDKGGVVSDEDQKDVVNQIANVKKLSSEVNDLVKEYNNMNDDNAKTIGKFNGQLNGASIDEYKRQLTEAVMAATNGKASIKGFDAETKTLTYSLKSGSHEFTNYTAAVRGADGALVSMQKETKRTETFIESLTRKTKEIGTYLISSLSLYDVVNKLRQGIQYVREIDSALTELKKVTDETEETYDRFLNTASKTADKVGSTIKEIVSSTADWSRLGYSMEEAAQLAESTSVLLNVSEFSSIDDATSALISTMQAFGYTAKDSMHVVDVMNEIGNNYAVSSDGIATALQDSASSLMAANNSYQEAVALIASANKVVQDPNSVGAALRTISLRLRGTSTKELEEAGEDTEGTITSKSKLRSKIKTLSGVDILTDTGAYKSTYQILLEISKVWEKMSDIDQAALLEIIAGKTRSNTAAAILSNTTDLENAYVDALHAEGSAYAENEKYLDSIQGKIDQLNNAVQTMWSNTLDDSEVKRFVSLGTEIVKLIDNLGLIKTLFIAIGTTYIYKNFGQDLFGDSFKKENIDNIDTINKKLQELKTKYEAARDAYNLDTNSKSKKNKFKQAKEDYELYNESTSSYRKSDELSKQLDKLKSEREKLQSELSDAEQELQDIWSQGESGDLSKEFEEASKKVDNLNVKIDENGKAIQTAEVELQSYQTTTQTLGKTGQTTWNKITDGAKKAGKAIGTVVKSMLVMVAVTTVIELIASGIEFLADKIKNAKESAEEAQEKLEKFNSELSNCESELRNLESQLDNTQEKIEELVSQGSLSYVEQEELERLQAVSAELERQIEFKQTLQSSLQKGANAAAVNATNKYLDTSFSSEESKSERQQKAEETGETIGKAAGLALGAAGAAVLAAKIGGTVGTFFGGPIGTAVGAGIGALIGGIAGKFAGSAAAGAKYDSEETVDKAISNMEENRAKLIEARDKALEAYTKNPLDKNTSEAYQEAETELNNYDAAMAKHISQIQANLNAMDWDTASDSQKKFMKEQEDLLDKYNIVMGGENAKSNAISRIFGQEVTTDLKNIGQEIQAIVDKGENVNLKEIFSDDQAYAEFEERLNSMGIEIQDVIDYFKYMKVAKDEAMEDTSITDSLSKISSIEDAFNSLGDAVKEFKEDGTASASTLKSLSESFGEIEGFEELYKVLATGEGNVEEAITNVANAYIAQKGMLSELSEEEQAIMIARLKSFGVINAEEVFQVKQKAQEELNALGEQYSIDLSNYATAEEAKLAIAQQLGLDVASIQDDQIETLAKKYGIDLSNYATVAEQKIAIAKKVARETAETNRATALSNLDREYGGNRAFVGSPEYNKKKQQIEDDYKAAIAAIPSDTISNQIKGIVENAYSSLKFDFSDNKVGIGRDYKDTISGSGSDSESALEKLKKEYENKISLLEAQQTYLENEISRLEASDQQVSRDLYDEQIKLEQEKLKLYEKEREELLAKMSTVAKDSDEWLKHLARYNRNIIMKSL